VEFIGLEYLPTNISQGSYKFKATNVSAAPDNFQNGTFRVGEKSYYDLAEQMAGHFTMTLTEENSIDLILQDAFAQYIYYSSLMDGTIRGIAAGMTASLQSCPSNGICPVVVGQPYTGQTFIQVRWNWLIPNLINVLFTAVLLLVTILEASAHKIPLWKSSVLALFFHGLHIKCHTEPVEETVGELDHKAKELRIHLEKVDKHGWGFVLVEGE